nr:hypothetical protein Iba_chr09aCG9340 [Ipomoea batatas]
MAEERRPAVALCGAPVRWFTVVKGGSRGGAAASGLGGGRRGSFGGDGATVEESDELERTKNREARDEVERRARVAEDIEREIETLKLGLWEASFGLGFAGIGVLDVF